MLFVSHDRYFINQVATRILNLTNEVLVNYLGNYDYYMEKCRELTEIYATPKGDISSAKAPASSESDVKLDWKQQKEEQARKRKLENELKRTEAEIETVEGRIAELEELFAEPEIATDAVRLGELQREYEEAKSRAEELYAVWEELAEK